MSDLIKRPNFDMQGFGGVLGDITPPQLNPLDPDAGVFGHWKYKKKMELAAKGYASEAAIATSQNTMVQQRTDMIMRVLLAGKEFEARNREYESKIKMLEYLEYQEQCKCRKMNAEASEAEASAETAQLNLQQMKKDMGYD